MSTSSPANSPASAPAPGVSDEPCPCGCERKGYTLVKNALRRELHGKTHMLIRPKKAWVFDPAVINYHLEKIKTLVVLDKDTGTTYTITLEKFMQESLFVDVGIGQNHLAVGVEDWEAVKDPSRSPRARRNANGQTSFQF